MSRSSISPLVENEAKNEVANAWTNGTAPPMTPQRKELVELPPLKQSNGTPVNGTPLVKRHIVPPKAMETTVSLEIEENEKGMSSLDYRKDINMEFYLLLGPLIKCMSLFGLWHGYVVDPVHNPPPKTTFKRIFNQKNYCIFAQVLLWFNTLRYAPAFFVGSYIDPIKLVPKVIFSIFTLQCALNSSVFFYCLSKKDKVSIFFHHFELAIQSNPTTAVDKTWLKRASWACTVVAIIFMVVHCLNQAANAYLPIETFRNNSLVFIAPMYYSAPLHAFFGIIYLYNFAAWIFPLLFFVLICIILSRQFVKLDQRLERSLRKARIDGCFPKDFEVLRRQHEALATALDTSNDGLFTYVNLVTYATMAPLAVFLLYRIITSPSYQLGLSGWFFYWTWMINIFINVIIVSWIAAITSTKAHDPRERLFLVNLWNITNEEIMQMNVFLNRVSGDPMGYTIFDLVTITKPFILTIGGLLLTFYAIISEFNA
ncbi:uncharacterized protein LOC121419973 [Lytechinus variegatus]|uniref:uncharacterized protein LOC121419973 n=1 Tax=Lytechinus variegatus TaxID=7654 RepID=UPI001BB1455B|nr:uncharacterized protein LOC121419973 [Lytechinus variegatus]